MNRLGFLAVVSACSGGAAGPDAPAATDASFDPPQCAVAPGHAFTMSGIGFQQTGVGFDLNGDGTVDNALGFLAPITNQVLNDDIARGFSRYIFNVEHWDNPPADDPDVGMVSFAGVDADRPANLSNDFTGSGEFYVTGRDFDVNCNPRNVSRSGSITNGELDLRADRWSMFVRNIGVIAFVKVRILFRMAADLSTGEGEMGAVLTSCGMSRAFFPQLGSGTLLDLVLQQDRQADIDVDGDGLETISYVAGQVSSCRDGDGTLIPGPQCMCDPRIADGYSLGVFARGVSCKIDGVVGTE